MKIAILGAGAMGPVLAEQLLKAGHDVLVYNQIISKTKELIAKGATEMLSPTEAIYKSEAAIIVAENTEQLNELLMVNTDRRAFEGKPLLNGSITDPEQTMEIALVIKESGGSFSAMSLTSGPDEFEHKLSDFIVGSSTEDQEFWTDIFVKALPDPTHLQEEVTP